MKKILEAQLPNAKEKLMISIREAFGQSLLDLGRKNKDIVLVSCDLKAATKADYFFQAFPSRSFEVGIAEANAIGVAAGLSMAGFKPILSSFGAFLTGKNVEIRTSISYNNAPVVLIGTHGGLIGPDGATQSGIQDISIMRSMPRMKVFQPSSPILTSKILEHCISLDCPSYIRIARNEVPEIYEEQFSFTEGDPIFHCYNSEIILLSSGPMVHNCIEATTLLKENNNIEVGVIDIPSISPFNQKEFFKLIKNSKFLFSVEDHMTQGGLGSMIAEILCSSELNTKLFIKGLDDFVSSGKPIDLEKKYSLDPKSITDFVLAKIK